MPVLHSCLWLTSVAGDTYHTGVLSLPPGRYFLRFLVDDEYRVDDNQEVVRILGNLYNTLLVQDSEQVMEEDNQSSIAETKEREHKEQRAVTIRTLPVDLVEPDFKPEALNVMVCSTTFRGLPACDTLTLLHAGANQWTVARPASCASCSRPDMPQTR